MSKKVMADLALQLSAETAQLKKDLAKARGDIQGFGKKIDSMASGFKKAFIGVGAAIAGAFAADKILSLTKESYKLAAQAEDVERAFRALGRPGLLDDLRKAVNGTVSDFELMKAAVMANNFKIPLEQLAGYFKFAKTRAQETGQSVDYLVNSIVVGVARKSIPILDNLGISATDLRDKIQKTGDVGSAVGLIIEESFRKSGDAISGTLDKTLKMQTGLENFKEAWGSLMIEKGGTSFWTGASRMIDNFTDNLKEKTNPSIVEADKYMASFLSRIEGATPEEKIRLINEELESQEKLYRSLGKQFSDLPLFGDTRKEQNELDTQASYMMGLLSTSELVTRSLNDFLQNLSNPPEMGSGGLIKQIDDDLAALNETLMAATTEGQIKEIASQIAELQKQRADLLAVVPKVLTPKAYSFTAEDELAVMNDLNKEVDEGLKEMSGNTLKHQLERTKITREQAWKRFEIEDDMAKKTREAVQSELDNLNRYFSDMIGGAIEDLANSIGQAIGGGDFKEVIKGFVNTIGSFAQTFGSLIIAQGLSVEAFKKSLATFNGIGAIVAGGALIVAGAAVKAFANAQKFADGGIVGGSSYSGDRVPTYVNSGEMIFNKAQQANLFSLVNRGGREWETAKISIGLDSMDILMRKVDKRRAYR
jgi:hypothetical protein